MICAQKIPNIPGWTIVWTVSSQFHMLTWSFRRNRIQCYKLHRYFSVALFSMQWNSVCAPFRYSLCTYTDIQLIHVGRCCRNDIFDRQSCTNWFAWLLVAAELRVKIGIIVQLFGQLLCGHSTYNFLFTWLILIKCHWMERLNHLLYACTTILGYFNYFFNTFHCIITILGECFCYRAMRTVCRKIL